MKGFLPKRIAAAQLQCRKCTHFRDDDPDVFYCALDREEFAGLCDLYQMRPMSYQTSDEDDGYHD